ncbi:VCBS domain-containing protein [Marinomonas ostreistagni]|nr:VCBS domain-containing protein [Marinomonas ostreistagni]
MDLPAGASLTFSTTSTATGLTFNSDGTYTFDASSYDSLSEGETQAIVVPVTVTDDKGATDTTTLTITITGTNDAPVVSGKLVGAVTEGDVGDVITTSGTISISDVDGDDTPSFANTTVTGSYGSLTLVDGTWTYTLDQTKVQELDGAKGIQLADQVTDTITLTADDGTTQDIVITITGTDDAPVVSGVHIGTVTEGDLQDLEQTSGTITISDVDENDQPEFEAFSYPKIGTYGSLILSEQGIWTYTLDQTKVQDLDDGDEVTDTITLTATDGTTQDIVITIKGTDDAPELTSNIPDQNVNEGATLSIGAGAGSLLSYFEDPQNDGLEVSGISMSLTGANAVSSYVDGFLTLESAEFGTLKVASDGSYTYEAPVIDHTNSTDDIEPISFSFEVSDSNGNKSEWTTVTINVKDVGVESEEDTGTLGLDVTGETDQSIDADTAQGNVLENDAHVDDIEVTGVTYDGVLYEFAENASSLVVEADTGTLTINTDGSYTFEARDFSGDESPTWNNGFTLHGFGYGSAYVDADTGALDLSLADATVNQTSKGFGVSSDEEGNGNNNPINNSGTGGETLVYQLDTAAESIDFKAHNLNANDEVSVAAFDKEGNPIADVSFTITGNGDHTSINVSTAGSVAIAAIAFTFPVSADPDDQYRVGDIQSIEYPNPEIGETFTYHVKDTDGDTSSANLVISQGDGFINLQADYQKIFEDPQSPATGNVLTNDNAADDAKLGSFELEGTTYTFSDTQTSFEVDVEIEGAVVGKLEMSADGSYSFMPTEHWSGSLPEVTYTLSESGESSTLNIDVEAVADAPVFGVSEGLHYAVWHNVYAQDFNEDGIIDFNGYGASVEQLQQLLNYTASLRDSDSSEVLQALPADLNIDTENGLTTGDLGVASAMMYFEAGKTYSFSGEIDDSFYVSIDGNVIADGQWNSPTTESGDNDISGEFTATTSGFLPVHLVFHNQEGNGFLNVNVSVDGEDAVALNTTNFDLHPITLDGSFVSGGNTPDYESDVAQGLTITTWENITIGTQDGQGVIPEQLEETLEGLESSDPTSGPEEISAIDSTYHTLNSGDVGVLTTIKGYIYLEAGVSYQFSGQADDSFYIKLDGDLKATEKWSNGSEINGLDFGVTTDGFYEIELAHHNQNGPGGFSVNLKVGGEEKAINTDNFELFRTAEDIMNGALNPTYSGGIYITQGWNTGDEGTEIALEPFSVRLQDTDGSESLSMQVKSDAPAGTVLSDGTITITFSGNDSTLTDIPAGFDFNRMTVETPDGYTGGFELEFIATATEGSNDDQESASHIINVTVNEAPQEPTLELELDAQSAAVSEEALENGIKETTGDENDVITVQKSFTVSVEDGMTPTLTILEPQTSFKSGGEPVVWKSINGDMVGVVEGAEGEDDVEVIRISLSEVSGGSASYTVTLSAPVDHAAPDNGGSVENKLDFDFDIQLSDGVKTTTATVNVEIEDDTPAQTVAVEGDLTSTSTAATSVSVSAIVGGFSNVSFETVADEYDRTEELVNDDDTLLDVLTWSDNSNVDTSIGLVDSANQADVNVDSYISLGDFTHVNNGILTQYASLETSKVNYNFTLTIDGVEVSVSLAADVEIDETLNTNSADDSADTVRLSNMTTQEVVVNGSTYKVSLEGFQVEGQGYISDALTTGEGATSNATLVAKVEVVESAKGYEDITGTLTASNAFGADGGAVTAQVIETSDGKLTLAADGSYSFTPSDAFLANIQDKAELVASFDYQVTDNDGDSVTATLNITVNNDEPMLKSDSNTLNEDETLTVTADQGVLANDFGADLEVTSFTFGDSTAAAGQSITLAGEGKLTINADGSYEYVPTLDKAGTVPAITYTTNAGLTASLALSVTAVADEPTLEVTLGEPSAVGYFTAEDINGLGSESGSGIVNDETKYEEVGSTRTLSFGSANAGKEVTITFDAEVSGSWNTGTRSDTFDIQANGSSLLTEGPLTYNYGDRAESLSTDYDYSFTATLDANGDIELDFLVDSTDTLEFVNITNIKVELTTAPSSVLYPLTINAVENDQDGSEVLTFTVSGVPTDGRLVNSSGVEFEKDSETGFYKLDEEDIDDVILSVPFGQEAFNLTVSATSTDGDSTATVEQNIAVDAFNFAPEANDDVITVSNGLHGEYWGFSQQIGDLATFKTQLATRDADATFDAQTINYTKGLGTSQGVGYGDNLQAFLGDDAASLSNNPASMPDGDGGIRLSGAIYLEQGTYQFKVNADDGYEITIDGAVVANHFEQQSETEDTFGVFEIAETGYHNIEMLWFDQGGDYVFQPVLRVEGGEYLTLDNYELRSSSSEFATLTEGQSVVIQSEALLANDTDAENDTLSITSIDNVQHGYAYLNGEGNIVFVPEANYTGGALFDYTITDGNGNYDTATASLQINGDMSGQASVNVRVTPINVPSSSDIWDGFENGHGFGFNDYLSYGSKTVTFADYVGASDVYLGGNANGGSFIKTNFGSDHIQIAGNLDGLISTGDDADKVVVGSVNGNGTINTGSGSDSVYVKGNLDGKIQTEAGDDIVRIDGNIQGKELNLGSGDDVLFVKGMVNHFVDAAVSPDHETDSVYLDAYTAQQYAESTELQGHLAEFDNIITKDGVVVKGNAFDTSAVAAFSYAQLAVNIVGLDQAEAATKVTISGIPEDISVSQDGVLLARTGTDYEVDVIDGEVSGLTLIRTGNTPIDTDTLDVKAVVSTNGNNDGIIGSSDEDDKVGTGGDDYIEGTAGEETLLGNAGNDILFGGEDEAVDTLIGGAGEDIFVLHNDTDLSDDFTQDIIQDFDSSEDALDISDLLDLPTDVDSADMEAVKSFLEANVSVTEDEAGVKHLSIGTDDSTKEVATFGSDSSFDAGNASDNLTVIFNNQEFTINQDG